MFTIKAGFDTAEIEASRIWPIFGKWRKKCIGRRNASLRRERAEVIAGIKDKALLELNGKQATDFDASLYPSLIENAQMSILLPAMTKFSIAWSLHRSPRNSSAEFFFSGEDRQLGVGLRLETSGGIACLLPPVFSIVDGEDGAIMISIICSNHSMCCKGASKGVRVCCSGFI